ncbi:MAG: hypothetical protein F7B17_04560, partial [Desulfurococcales archaeon]|nr:hypothetical protein [Desulfurococcales archaeon]
ASLEEGLAGLEARVEDLESKYASLEETLKTGILPDLAGLDEEVAEARETAQTARGVGRNAIILAGAAAILALAALAGVGYTIMAQSRSAS